jgi:hypothetical protein
MDDGIFSGLKALDAALPIIDREVFDQQKLRKPDHGDGVIRVPPALARNKLKVPPCNRDRQVR